MTLYYRKKRRKIALFILFPLIIFSLLFYFYYQVSINFISLSEETVYAVCFNLINTIVADEIYEIGSENIIDYKYNSNGEIIAVNANVITMNLLNTKIAEEMIKRLSALTDLYVEVPLGSFISSSLFPAVGPSIPIKILPLSTVHTEYNTEFTSTGINQTQHKIFIKVNCSLSILSALATNNLEISIEIPIAETIIVGGVPNTYIEVPTQKSF